MGDLTDLEKKHGFPCLNCGATTFDEAGNRCRGYVDCPGDSMSSEVFWPQESSPSFYSVYRNLEVALEEIRALNGDAESFEEDSLLESMEALWEKLSKEEQDALDKEGRSAADVASVRSRRAARDMADFLRQKGAQEPARSETMEQEKPQ